MSLDQLKNLETKIGEFLSQHERVQQAREELQVKLRESEKQLAEAQARLKQFEKERDEVKGRLDRVLKRLEGLDLK